MAECIKIIIPTQKTGTTFKGITLEMTYSTDGITFLPMDLTGVQVDLDFRLEANFPSDLHLSTTDGGITVTDNLIIVDEFLIELNPNNYIFDALLCFENGDRDIYFDGNWKITPKITVKL